MCTGTTNIFDQTFNLPAGNLTSWEVDLAVTATWSDEAQTSFTVSVPGDESIDLLLQGAPAGPVPALSPWPSS